MDTETVMQMQFPCEDSPNWEIGSQAIFTFGGGTFLMEVYQIEVDPLHDIMRSIKFDFKYVQGFENDPS